MRSGYQTSLLLAIPLSSQYTYQQHVADKQARFWSTQIEVASDGRAGLPKGSYLILSTTSSSRGKRNSSNFPPLPCLSGRRSDKNHSVGTPVIHKDYSLTPKRNTRFQSNTPPPPGSPSITSKMMRFTDRARDDN